jgi:hypothetical protein
MTFILLGMFSLFFSEKCWKRKNPDKQHFFSQLYMSIPTRKSVSFRVYYGMILMESEHVSTTSLKGMATWSPTDFRGFILNAVKRNIPGNLCSLSLS